MAAGKYVFNEKDKYVVLFLKVSPFKFLVE